MRRVALAVLCVSLASGASAQEATCDGDAALAERAPTVHAMLADTSWVALILDGAEWMVEALEEHAPDVEALACLYAPGEPMDTDALISYLGHRQTVVGRLSEAVSTWSAAQAYTSSREYRSDEEAQAIREAFAEEMLGLGVRAIHADGGIASLGFGPLEVPPQAHAPPDLAAFVSVQEAVGRTVDLGGLYIGDLMGEVDVVGRGEAFLTRFPSSEAGMWVREHHARGLLLLASLHPVEGAEDWMVGAGNATGLPIGPTRAALDTFVVRYPDSRYASVFASILADPPVVGGPHDLDVLVVSRSQYRQGAEMQALAWLDVGIDVVGPIRLHSREWGVAYRYYPSGDPRVALAEGRARLLGLAPERVIVDARELNRLDWR